MSKLNGLVNHFVDQILETIRVASIEDIMGVMQTGRSAPAPRGVEPRKRATRGAKAAKPAKARRAAVPLANEITDPEMILAAGASPEPAPIQEKKRPRRASATVAPPPEAAPPPPRPTAIVRSDETIVRASSAGVVIRRAKKDA
jgi:hypothetical protein